MLSLIEGGSRSLTPPHGFLRVAGTTIAQHQLAIARALGCVRLVCIARGSAPELIALQHDAEAEGMSFHIVAEPRGLSGLSGAMDEILVLADGLLADAQEVAALVGDRPCVLVQPAEGAVEAGFERIDASHASGGVALIPGKLVEGLHDLPSDCDVVSSLTRIALQSGLPRKDVPIEHRAGVKWLLITNENTAQAIEGQWLRHAIGEARHHSPGHHLSRLGAVMLGSMVLHGGGGLRLTGFAVVAIFAAAAAFAWNGFLALGFGLLALAWIVAGIHEHLHNVRRHEAAPGQGLGSRAKHFAWLCDLVIVLMVAVNTPESGPSRILEPLFAPVILILLLRLVPEKLPEIWDGWVRDRAVLAIVLGVSAALGLLTSAVQLFAIVLGILGLASAGRNRA